VASKIQEYIAKALEAEERAAHTENPVLRDSWLTLAESYRVLAKHEEEKGSKEN
jgi:hypothetical protein